MSDAIKMSHPEKGVYIVEYKGNVWHYDNFADANKHMQSLVRPPTGDPK